MSDDLDLFCKTYPARAAQALRDENQERQNHYSREARLMERNEDLLAKIAALTAINAILLAACQAALECHDGANFDVSPTSAPWFQRVDAVLRAAIAKAEGT